MHTPINLDPQKEAIVNIETNRTLGKIRRLHGSNLAPYIGAQKIPSMDISEDLRSLDIPLTRLHDAPLNGCGMRLIDIHQIFPLFHLNHNDSRNYYFDHTDDYIANCLATGTKINYRLGESIEHSLKQYFVHPPHDYEKWAEICCNIIAHYNEGWSNGFHHNIEYWTIWEEPNTVPFLWTGTWGDYIQLYVLTAKKIKHRFPMVKVGGPAMYGLGENQITEFLMECKRQQAPLDFFTWTMYANNPDPFIQQPEIARRILSKYGFENTELHLAEWHYIDPGWVNQREQTREKRLVFAKTMTGINSAACVTATLSGLQDTPITMANHYAGTAFDLFGLFDGVTYAPNKNYFAMKAFNLMTKYENRIEVKSEAGDNIWVLAGRKVTGETAILISCFKTKKREIVINFGNYKFNPDQCNVSVIDIGHDLTPMEHVKITGNAITLEKPAGSAVFLMEIMK
ncbi:MAG: hypothetical protein WCS96_05550 [Victivallales bacterium]